MSRNRLMIFQKLLEIKVKVKKILKKYVFHLNFKITFAGFRFLVMFRNVKKYVGNGV